MDCSSDYRVVMVKKQQSRLTKKGRERVRGAGKEGGRQGGKKTCRQVDSSGGKAIQTRLNATSSMQTW